MYYTISSIPPEHRSSLDNIFSALYFHAQDKYHGTDEVFRPVINDLLNLEKERILVVTPEGKETRSYFALVVLFGDNLRVHWILSFSECFNANYYCIACKVTRPIAQLQVRLDKSLLRNRENYNLDLQKKNVSETGLTGECVWNQFKSYHCTENLV